MKKNNFTRAARIGSPAATQTQLEAAGWAALRNKHGDWFWMDKVCVGTLSRKAGRFPPLVTVTKKPFDGNAATFTASLTNLFNVTQGEPSIYSFGFDKVRPSISHAEAVEKQKEYVAAKHAF